MNIRHLFALFLAFLMPFRVGEATGVGVDDVGVDDVADELTDAEAGADTVAGGDAAEPAKPASMLEAINQALAKPQDQDGRARDAQGRFVTKPADAKAADPRAEPAKVDPKADPKAAKKPTDMPEGLTPKSQERFQTLVNERNELKASNEALTRQVEFVRSTFTQEQFQTAADIVGMIKSGNLRGARDVLVDQLRQITIALGEPMQGVDALAGHPDLRQAVDAMQMTEAHALELAKHRTVTQHRETHDRQAHQQREAQLNERQAVESGMQAVDDVVKRIQSTDMDWPAIEAHILPEIPNLLRGVQPNQWAAVIENQYRLLKKVAGSRQQQPQPNVLRPNGQASPAAAPKSLHEAMWGTPRP